MISQKNMVQLLLPMISCYMLNPEIQSKNAPLVFYAQEFLELACGILNWKEYDKQLKYYLGKFKDVSKNRSKKL